MNDRQRLIVFGVCIALTVGLGFFFTKSAITPAMAMTMKERQAFFQGLAIGLLFMDLILCLWFIDDLCRKEK